MSGWRGQEVPQQEGRAKRAHGRGVLGEAGSDWLQVAFEPLHSLWLQSHVCQAQLRAEVSTCVGWEGGGEARQPCYWELCPHPLAEARSLCAASRGPSPKITVAPGAAEGAGGRSGCL